MTQFKYDLCQTDYVALLMWLFSLCVFPPLMNDSPISLTTSNSLVKSDVEVPVEKSYEFILKFKFTSKSDYFSNYNVWGGNWNKYCSSNIDYDSVPVSKKETLGKPLRFNIKILDLSNGKTVINKTVMSRCVFARSSGDYTLSRRLNMVNLMRGSYTVVVTYLDEPLGYTDFKTFITLQSYNVK